MTAAEFLQARDKHLALDKLPSNAGFNLDAAYTMEREIMNLRVRAGHSAVGRKVGYANKAMWRVLKLDTLVWAHMYDDTVKPVPYGSIDCTISKLRSPKIEPEIVIKVRDPLAGEGLAMAEWIALGFEIIDCPFPEWKFTPVDFVAAWGLHAALIVGPPLTVTPENMDALTAELAEFKVPVTRDNDLVEEGSGKNSLKSPALCLTELARACAARETPLQPGELISTGTLTAGHMIAAGEEWKAEPAGISLPGLCVRLH